MGGRFSRSWLSGQGSWWFAAGEITSNCKFEEAVVADKSSFTKEEWTLLLESPMMAGMAITAADPSGLWGLLKESFASGTALAKVMTDAGANPLVKALATDFSTSEARSIARDGLKASSPIVSLQTSRPNRSKVYVRLRRCWRQRPRAMLLRSGAGCARSARLPLKRPARVAACLVLAAFRLVRLRKRPWPKFPARSGFEEADRQARCETLHLTEANDEPWNAIDACSPWDACRIPATIPLA